MRKGNSMRVDRGLGPGGGLKRAGNMLGEAAAAAAAMEECATGPSELCDLSLTFAEAAKRID